MAGQYGTRVAHAIRTWRKRRVGVPEEVRIPAQQGKTMVLPCWRATRSQHATATRQNHGFALLPCKYLGLVPCLLISFRGMKKKSVLPGSNTPLDRWSGELHFIEKILSVRMFVQVCAGLCVLCALCGCLCAEFVH